MTTWFISDLHLDPTRPTTTTLFLDFLHTIHGKAEALYILGDLFEFWIGDDVLDTPLGQTFLPLTQELRRVSDAGTRIYFQHGNRDFVLGEDFAARCGLSLLPETQIIQLYGQPTLIMHGDTLCTDDVAYQKARRQFRDPAWQAQALSLSIPERLKLAQAIRSQSQSHTAEKSEIIMDVNPHTVEQTMQDAGVLQLIHGHTHRPNVHHFELDHQAAKRVVLGDWYKQGSFLQVTADEMVLTHTYH
ncbi:UDP-2,3-diacylglucosamine diphosphatase [Thiolinea disciformis]|uniref:UDP-2,3-diacylglucosamine diphosphatase n=1 Tax=Thiolinea disciformis TaxID=125614 RepID=UPI00038252C9|nr:UDP-2,3-diacylglucosamine diphosphatase [Thiolinea disciformis]